MAQIEIKKLTFRYPFENKKALNNVSLSVKEGDVVVIFGKSGCGKSTLLRHLKPAIRPEGDRDGSVFYYGVDLDKVDERKQAEKIGFVMQKPEHQLVTDKVWHELAFGLENLGYEKESIRLRVAEMAEYFGMSDWFYKDVQKLSGGQKQLLNLASVMTLHPDILILDEPTAQLDPISAEIFLDTVIKLNRDLGMTVIITEHRLNNILPYADKAVLMDEGKIIKEGRPEDISKEITDSRISKLLSVPAQIFIKSKSQGKVPMSILQGRRWLQEVLSDKQNIAREQIKNCHKEEQNPYSHKADKSKEAVNCTNLWFRYERSGKDIIKNLNLKVKAGEIFAILGGNGTGKTTTLSILSGINKPYRGKVRIQGRVAALPQNVQTLFRQETVAAELAGVNDKIIADMELEDVLTHHPYDISMGQQQKVALAKILSKNPDILLLDEPTQGLDGIYKEKLGKILTELKKTGKTIIMVSHDVDFCGEYGDRCGLFADGGVIAVNNYRDFFANNRFYTTAVNRMSKGIVDSAVKQEDILCYLTEGNIM